MLDISNVFKTVSYNYAKQPDACITKVNAILEKLGDYYAELHIVSEQLAFDRIDTTEATRRGQAIDVKYIKIFNELCVPGGTDKKEEELG